MTFPDDSHRPDSLVELLPAGWSVAVSGNDREGWTVVASRQERGTIVETVSGQGERYQYGRDECAAFFARQILNDWFRAGFASWQIERGHVAGGTLEDPFVVRHLESRRLWLIACQGMPLSYYWGSDLQQVRLIWDPNLVRRFGNARARLLVVTPGIIDRPEDLLGLGELYGEDVRIRDYEAEDVLRERLDAIDQALVGVRIDERTPDEFVELDLAIQGAARRSLGMAPPLPWPNVFWRAIGLVGNGVLFMADEDEGGGAEVYDQKLGAAATDIADSVVFMNNWDNKKWARLARVGEQEARKRRTTTPSEQSSL